MKQHPEFTALIPILLDRGDPEGRTFALQFAVLAETPEALAALRDLALGQRGPDAMRMEAMRAATRAGLLPSGAVRMWVEGEWREIREPRCRQFLTGDVGLDRPGEPGAG